MKFSAENKTISTLKGPEIREMSCRESTEVLNVSQILPKCPYNVTPDFIR